MADTLPWTRSDADRSVSSRSDFVSDGNYAGELKLLEFAIDTISCCLGSRFSASTAHAAAVTQLRAHDGQVQQRKHDVLHARVSVGQIRASRNVAQFHDRADNQHSRATGRVASAAT